MNYHALLDSVRCNFARRALARPDASVSEVAYPARILRRVGVSQGIPEMDRPATERREGPARGIRELIEPEFGAAHRIELCNRRCDRTIGADAGSTPRR